jgi:hypothetical protein
MLIAQPYLQQAATILSCNLQCPRIFNQVFHPTFTTSMFTPVPPCTMNEGPPFNSNIWIYILKSLAILPNFVTCVSNNGKKFSLVGDNS